MNDNINSNKKDTNDTMTDIMTHKLAVKQVIGCINAELNQVASRHDNSKLSKPELSVFTKVTTKLKNLQYGSPEYKEQLKEMGEGLEHHYKFNEHHPEHFSNGVSGMNIVNIIEMLSDWKASSLRTKDGDFLKSLEINMERFNITGQLKDVIMNSFEYFFVFNIKLYNEEKNYILSSFVADNKDDIINTINHMTFEDDEKKSIINCLDVITNFQGNQIKYAEGAVDKLGKISDFYKLKNGRYVEIIYRPTLDLSVKHYSDINS